MNTPHVESYLALQVEWIQYFEQKLRMSSVTVDDMKKAVDALKWNVVTIQTIDKRPHIRNNNNS